MTMIKEMVLGLGAIIMSGSPALATEIERNRVPDAPNAPILESVKVNPGAETLYLSGQLASPMDPQKRLTMEMTRDEIGDTKTQAVSTLGKIKRTLERHGYKMSDIVRMTVYLVGDPQMQNRMDFRGFNDAFSMFFNNSQNPESVARSVVQVAGLAVSSALVEIDIVAARNP